MFLTCRTISIVALTAVVFAMPILAEEKTFDLTAQRFEYIVSPGGAIVVNQGDVVTLRITAATSDSIGTGVTHGFHLDTYMSGNLTIDPGETEEVVFTAHTAGSFDYFCTRVCGGGHSSMNGTMVVIAAPEPLTVTEVSPAGGSIAGGTDVTISGTGFEDGADVTFDGLPASNFSVENSTRIEATTPAHAAGSVDVAVTNPDDESATLENGYTYSPPPSITSVDPDSGPASGGTAVTIDGSGFQSGATVRFANKSATGVSVSESEITATTPSGSGTVDVSVTNPDEQEAVSADAFTYIPSPAISSISPNRGSVVGGTSVVVSGSGFQNGAFVTFDGLVATNIVVGGSSSISCTTPAHGVGVVDVTVENPDGQSATRNNGFTYVEGPAINSVVPDSGPVEGGTPVTIEGGGFQNGASVTFGGVPGTSVVFVDSMHLTCVTPAHSAGVVDLTVTNPDLQTTTLEGAFSFESFSIHSIDPESGPVTGGTEFILSGSGFQEGAIVAFGSSIATDVVVQSGTTITGTTPLHPAGAVDVTVTNPDESSTTLEDGYTYSGVLRRRPARRPGS